MARKLNRKYKVVLSIKLSRRIQKELNGNVLIVKFLFVHTVSFPNRDNYIGKNLLVGLVELSFVFGVDFNATTSSLVTHKPPRLETKHYLALWHHVGVKWEIRELLSFFYPQRHLADVKKSLLADEYGIPISYRMPSAYYWSASLVKFYWTHSSCPCGFIDLTWWEYTSL